MNERFSQLISPAWKLKCRALGRILRRSMVIEVAGNYSTSRKVRTWRILAKSSNMFFLFLFYFSERCIHRACRNGSFVRWDRTFGTIFYYKWSNKVKVTATNSESSRYYEKLTKHERFKYLLKELDPSSFTVCGKCFHKLGSPITKEQFVYTRAHARVHVCVFTCMRRLCMFAYMCVNVCVCVIVYVCAWFLFHNSQGYHPIGQPK